jgi:hypothetical protein
VGRIYGFRSRIVHAGEQTPIHPELSMYRRALFTDVLLQMLGLPSRQAAGTFMDNPWTSQEFDLAKLLRS